MKYGIYADLRVSDDYSIFDFVSIGRNGNIQKRIEFIPTDVAGIYNLAFGDVDGNGQIDDYAISDNGDRNKVLATVAYAVEIYLTRYPDRWLYFKGSTDERTRLYRMAIGINLQELSVKFEIYAEQKNGFSLYEQNVDLIGVLVRKK